MIRVLRAIAWLRWRLLLNSLSSRRQRDAVESSSRWLALLVPILLGIVVLGFAVLLGVGALAGGLALAEGTPMGEVAAIVVRLLLLILTFVFVMMPMAQGRSGGLAQGSRMAILPIPRSLLHAMEVSAGISDPWILFILPALCLLPVGLFLKGKLLPSLLIGMAGLSLVACFLALCALVSHCFQWLMRERRRGEAVMVAIMLVASCSGLLMAGFGQRIEDGIRGTDRTEKLDVADRLATGVNRAFPVWLRPLPSELYGFAITDAAKGRSGAAALGVGLLFAEAGLLFLVSAGVHRKLAETPTTGGKRGRVNRWPRAISGHWLPERVAALALTQARVWVRTVRGRMAICLPGLMLLAMGYFFSRIRNVSPFLPEFLAGPLGPLVLGGGLLVSLLSIQPMCFNQFASDRSGLTLVLLSPMRMEDVAVSKSIASGFLYVMSASPCFAAAWIVYPGGHPALWASTLLGGAGMLVAMSPMATMVSAWLPRRSDLGEIGSAGNPHPLAGLVGTVLTLAFALIPAAVTLTGWTIMGSPWLTLVLQAGWCGIAAVFAFLMRKPCVAIITARLESIALSATGR